jgi:hypothetical protein
LAAQRRLETSQGLDSLCTAAAAGDAGAIDRLWEVLAPLLERSILRRFYRVPDEWIHDAVQDALNSFRANSRQFDPSRGASLRSFLWKASYRNLQNRIDRERLRGVRHVDVADAEALAACDGRTLDRDLDLKRALVAVRATLVGVEIPVFDLIVEGETRTHVLVKVAGIDDLTTQEQSRGVKRIVNRIFQRIRRWGHRRRLRRSRLVSSRLVFETDPSQSE